MLPDPPTTPPRATGSLVHRHISTRLHNVAGAAVDDAQAAMQAISQPDTTAQNIDYLESHQRLQV
jgi:hypothetical protein